MATSEILGLFTTPEQYQLAQQQAQQAQAIQYANLDPMARANYGTFLAGQKLGGAIGGALGGQDPQLKIISMRQQLASQLNPNDPESYMKIAEIAAQSGDQQFAIAVADAGRKAMSEYALIQQRTRERQGADPFQQIIRSGKYTPASLSAYQKSGNVADLVLLEKEGANKPFEFEAKEARLQELKSGLRVMENQPVQNKEAIQRLKDSIQAIEGVEKKEKTNIIDVGVAAKTREVVYFDKDTNEQFVMKPNPTNPNQLIRSPYSGGIDKTTASVTATASSKQAAGINQNKLDLAKSVEESAFSASDRISLAQSLRELSPKAFTGFAADAKLTASKVASAFGIPTKGGTESEIIDQILGQMTIGSAGQLKGALSDKDVLFLKKTIGTRGLSVNTLLFVADEIERLAAQDRHLNKRINQVTQSGGNLNEVNFEEEKSKSSSFVKKQMSEYRNILKKVANNTATLEEATKARQIRDELGL
jgi:hypothetical protein